MEKQTLDMINTDIENMSLELSEAETPEDQENILKRIEDSGIALVKKQESYFRADCHFDNQIAYLDDIIEKATAAKSVIQNRKQSFREFVKVMIMKWGKISHPLFSAYNRETESVNITDESKIPEKYYQEKIVKTIIKTAIKDAIASGEIVPGAEILKKTSVTIKSKSSKKGESNE